MRRIIRSMRYDAEAPQGGEGGREMAYWLVKSEPSAYSWERLVADGRTHWDGVKNPQAQHNLRAMREGDRAFFYHSQVGKEIVGVVEIVRSFYPDPADPSGKRGMVDVRPLTPAPNPVGLAAMKGNPELRGLSLFKQPRLSVCPLSEREWAVLSALAGLPG
jgi:predicted RNA-binding protein with PUA-like domain